MAQLSPKETQELIQLSRNVVWRYQLDQYEDEALKLLLKNVTRAQGEILRELDLRARGLFGKGLTQWSEERSLALLDELADLIIGLRAQLAGNIAEITSHAGERSYLTHNNIASWDGKVRGWNDVALSAAQVKSLALTTPVGGRLLEDWVGRAIDSTLVSGIKDEIVTGMLKGEGYPALISRIRDGFGMAEREVITLTRTYVQSANVGAQQAVYEANKGVVKGVKWVATLELGGFGGKKGGTCLMCASLDGREWKWGEPRPECPLHPRCRCLLTPITLTWRELGLDVDEMEQAYRPWTRRTPENIDAGGTRTILEHGLHGGDYSTWFNGLSKPDRLDIVGPGRFKLMEAGKIDFEDLVDPATGRLRLLRKNRSGTVVGLAS